MTTTKMTTKWSKGNNTLLTNYAKLRSKAWVFTFNNYTQDEIETVNSVISKAKYGCYSLEIAPSTGTKHIQGYVYYNNDITFESICKKMTNKKKDLECEGMEDETEKEEEEKIVKEGHKCWIAKAKGNAESNRIYIKGPYQKGNKSKPENETFREYGDMPKQGYRTDLDQLRDEIFSGETTVKKIAKENPIAYRKYSRTLIKLQEIKISEIPTFKQYTENDFIVPLINLKFMEDKNCENEYGRAIVLTGKPGTGKTNYAIAHFENPWVVRNFKELKKFRPKLHDGIIFDDMSFTHLPRGVQAHLLDWEISREIRVPYGIMEIPRCTKKIFITNKKADEIFSIMVNGIIDETINRRMRTIEIDKSLFALK